jgi:hypothetical protein
MEDNKVQLGCGTLIIIALIVAAFSGHKDSSELRPQLQALTQQISALEQKLDRVEKKLDALAARPDSHSSATLHSAEAN